MGRSGIRTSRGLPLLCAWLSRRWGAWSLRSRAPAAALVVLPPMASALLRYARSPSRRHSGGAGIRRLCALSARLPPLDADGCAVGAQKPARPSRRLRCAPPVPLLRRSRAAASAGGRFVRLPPFKFFCSGGGWSLRAPSAAAPPSPVSLRAAEEGGACLPVGRLKPPPLLRPRPPLNSGGGGIALPRGG